jgi:hypothetical protein
VDNGSIAYYNWFAYEFWRFVFVQQEVAKAAQTLIEFLPMQGRRLQHVGRQGGDRQGNRRTPNR